MFQSFLLEVVHSDNTVFVVMEFATRRVHLAACFATLGDECLKQVAGNLTDPFDGCLKDKRYVRMDRDSSFGCAVPGR